MMSRRLACYSAACTVSDISYLTGASYYHHHCDQTKIDAFYYGATHDRPQQAHSTCKAQPGQSRDKGIVMSDCVGVGAASEQLTARSPAEASGIINRRRTVNRDMQRDWRRRRREYVADLEVQVRYAKEERDERIRELEQRVEMLLRENTSLKETVRRIQSALSMSHDDNFERSAGCHPRPANVADSRPADIVLDTAFQESTTARSTVLQRKTASSQIEPSTSGQESFSDSRPLQFQLAASEVSPTCYCVAIFK